MSTDAALTRGLLALSLACDWARPASGAGAAAVQPEPASLSAPAALAVAAVASPSPNEQHTVTAAAPLVLRSALPVVADGNFQPSGLLARDGALLTVSDKHDGAIYALERDGGVARARPFVLFEPPSDEPAPLDFEGLAAAGDSAWLLVSESSSRVLRVDLDGARGDGAEEGPRRARARWVSPAVRELARASGCLTVTNAGLEGLTLLPGGGLLLAMERQPRGLIALGAAGTLDGAKVWQMSGSMYPVDPARGTDFTDLTRVGDEVYALARNAHLIVKLEHGGPAAPSAAPAASAAPTTPSTESWREGLAFSYRDVENDPRYSYQNRKYGLAEGMAVTGDEVLIVLDNNGQERAAHPGDRRPLLFVFERPEPL